jgi:hypothetical protein
MAPPIVAPMPEWLDLAGAYTIRFDAVDPATGATVAGVVVSDASLFGDAAGQTSVDSIFVGPAMLIAGPNA